MLADPRSSRLSEPEKALFTFLDKVNADSPSIAAADLRRLHQSGWSDEALYDAITVCALFNFYNRWIDATGVHAMSEQGFRLAGKRMARTGYLRTTEPRPKQV